jgi:hypothetical protein
MARIVVAHLKFELTVNKLIVSQNTNIQTGP